LQSRKVSEKEINLTCSWFQAAATN